MSGSVLMTFTVSGTTCRADAPRMAWEQHPTGTPSQMLQLRCPFLKGLDVSHLQVK